VILFQLQTAIFARTNSASPPTIRPFSDGNANFGEAFPPLRFGFAVFLSNLRFTKRFPEKPDKSAS
jgi:hypothetical protein